jgi:Flp pilus assembly protein TadB
MLLIIAISTFVFISLGMMGAYWLLNKPQSASTERLKRLGEKAPTMATGSISIVEDRSSELAERLASPLSRLLPPSAAEAKKLQKQLMQAGIRSSSGPILFRAFHLLSMAAFPAVVALGCALMARPLANATFYILLAFVVGFFLPRYILRKMIRSRQQLVTWGLADALDLMVISIEAGLGLRKCTPTSAMNSSWLILRFAWVAIVKRPCEISPSAPGSKISAVWWRCSSRQTSLVRRSLKPLERIQIRCVPSDVSVLSKLRRRPQ